MKEKDLIAMFNKITINGNREMTQERFIQAINELMAIKSTRRSERRADGSNKAKVKSCQTCFGSINEDYCGEGFCDFHNRWKAR